VIRQHHVRGEELGEAGDRDGLGPAYLAQRSNTHDRRRRLPTAWPREGRSRPWETDFSGLDGGVGKRSNPLCDGTRGKSRDDERSAPREETPAPARGAQPGNDLELVIARRGELSANFGEAFFVFPRQRPLAGMGRTLVPPAVVAVHIPNAKAETRAAVGTSTISAAQGRL
jgi:hypothetical protein